MGGICGKTTKNRKKVGPEPETKGKTPVEGYTQRGPQLLEGTLFSLISASLKQNLGDTSGTFFHDESIAQAIVGRYEC
jgi:hypothetical protein